MRSTGKPAQGKRLERLRQSPLWHGAGVLMPVHWGTFSLAMHAWDEPVETLLSLADPQDVHLSLPQLGQPVEPSERRPVDPWWRRIVSDEPEQREDASLQQRKLADKLPWPLD